MALSEGLVGYWSPWLGSSGYRLLDRTAYANHGTLTNMDAGADWVGATVQGKSGYALDFDGTNDFVNYSATTGKIPNYISVGCWFRTSQTTTGRLTTKPRVASSQQAYSLAINLTAGRVSWIVNTSVTNATIASTTTINTNAWFFVVGTYDGTTSRLFVNGTQETSVGLTGSILYTNDLPFQVGRFDALGQYFAGQIGGLWLWERSLTATEVRQLYRVDPGWYRPYAKRSIGFAAVAGFKAYWHRRQSQLIGGGVR